MVTGSPLSAPFPWFGGKRRAAGLIWSRLGDTANYVEPFAGSLAVLLARPHAPRLETINDLDCYVANFWRALAHDPEQVAHWADWPVNECDLHARHRWLVERTEFRESMRTDPEYFDAKVAGWWVWGISQWIGGGWCSRPEWVGRGQGGRAPRGLNTINNQKPHLSSAMGVFGNLDGVGKRPVINSGSRGVIGRSRGWPGWSIRPDLHSPMGVHRKRPHINGNGATGVHRKLSILDWMLALSERLRSVRVLCGDWQRVVTPSCTWKIGGGQTTGILLDPPYDHDLRDAKLYAHDDGSLSAAVRAWAITEGDNPHMRIALCGLAGEHDMPADWSVAAWRAPRGYSNRPKQERVWFSPYCLPRTEDLFSVNNHLTDDLDEQA